MTFHALEETSITDEITFQEAPSETPEEMPQAGGVGLESVEGLPEHWKIPTGGRAYGEPGTRAPVLRVCV